MKKHQFNLVFESGQVRFIEFNFTYNTSMTNCNHKNREDFAYVAVVDGLDINITPLGKFVMPPPMFEKQIKLTSFPTCLSLFGNSVVAYGNGKLHVFDCEKGQESL